MERRIKAYMNMADVEEMYIKLTGSRKGIAQFMKKAKEVAQRTPYGYYIFKREDKLFDLFKQEMPEVLNQRRFTCWGHLVQYVS